MATVTASLDTVARDVFAGLGYEIQGEGEGFRAVRGWKDVRVVPTEDVAAVSRGDGSLRCFVTWRERAGPLLDAVREREPAGPWALVAVSPEGEHEVVRAPTSG